MDRFDFLKKHPSFSSTQEDDGCLDYIYILQGHCSYITIPMFPSSILEWCFSPFDGGTLHCLYDELEVAPLWFQALVNEAQAALDYRERVRNLLK